jgi:hypothetical protein
VDYRLPDLLDPHYRPVNPRRVPAADLVVEEPDTAEERLQKVCDYGRTLWVQLAATRAYLRDTVGGGGAGEDSAALTDALLSGGAHWQQWCELYAQVCSALAGATGDSGFGRSEATLIARAHGVEVTRAE